MRLYNSIKTILVIITAASINISCDNSTEANKTGNARLLYQLEKGTIPRPNLKDVSIDGSLYIVKGYDTDTKERQLWYIEPPNEPVLIGSDSEWGLGFPKISPDKLNVVYEDFDGVYVIPISGGEPNLIFPKFIDAQPHQWLDNETVLIDSLEDVWYVKTVDINTRETTTVLDLGANDINSVCMSPDRQFLGVTVNSQFRLYEMDTMRYKEYYGTHSCYAWSPDGTKIRFHNEYMDFETDEFITYYEPNADPELSLYYAAWGSNSNSIIAGEQHYYNIYNYDYFRIYEISIE